MRHIFFWLVLTTGHCFLPGKQAIVLFRKIATNIDLENCEPKVGNELNNLKETNYNSYAAIQKFTMDFEDERLGAESFCTLLIASLDDEISTCCQFKGLGKPTVQL